MTYPIKFAMTRHVWILLGAATLAITAALWLRFSHTPFHHALTQVIGPDDRAALEHMLCALGLPMFLHMMLLVRLPAVVEATFKRVVRRAMMWSVSAWKQRAETVLAARCIVLRGRYCHASWTDLRTLSNVLAHHCGAIISTTYFACAVAWESYQAYVSVYGGPPRGYLQYDQLLADAVGASYAVAMAGWCMRPH
jgi:hypothetical protein